MSSQYPHRNRTTHKTKRASAPDASYELRAEEVPTVSTIARVAVSGLTDYMAEADRIASKNQTKQARLAVAVCRWLVPVVRVTAWAEAAEMHPNSTIIDQEQRSALFDASEDRIRKRFFKVMKCAGRREEEYDTATGDMPSLYSAVRGMAVTWVASMIESADRVLDKSFPLILDSTASPLAVEGWTPDANVAPSKQPLTPSSKHLFDALFDAAHFQARIAIHAAVCQVLSTEFEIKVGDIDNPVFDDANAVLDASARDISVDIEFFAYSRNSAQDDASEPDRN